MSHQEELSCWMGELSKQFPHLSRPQVTVLAMYSFGTIIVRRCGLNSVALFLSLLLRRKEGTVRQQLREFFYDVKQKRGDKRQEIDVTTCFGPLLRWILSHWPPDEERLALAMDASSLRQNFVVLAISVVYRGCAIPVAWIVLPASKKGSWQPYWLALLAHLDGVVPEDWTVIVLTDRGLYAKWLYKAIRKNGWHPFMRINKGGKFRPQGQERFRSLKDVVPQIGAQWCGEIDCFITQSARLACTLLARWDDGYEDPWLILTDLPPDVAQATWYGMRTWIEGGFKDVKRGGWHWEQTKMTDPERATRLWLVIALATLWVVRVGGEADASLPISSLDDLPETHIARKTKRNRLPPRRLSCFNRGQIMILVSLIKGEPIPVGGFFPEVWPSTTPNRPDEHVGYGVLDVAPT